MHFANAKRLFLSYRFIAIRQFFLSDSCQIGKAPALRLKKRLNEKQFTCKRRTYQALNVNIIKRLFIVSVTLKIRVKNVRNGEAGKTYD